MNWHPHQAFSQRVPTLSGPHVRDDCPGGLAKRVRKVVAGFGPVAELYAHVAALPEANRLSAEELALLPESMRETARRDPTIEQKRARLREHDTRLAAAVAAEVEVRKALEPLAAELTGQKRREYDAAVEAERKATRDALGAFGFSEDDAIPSAVTMQVRWQLDVRKARESREDAEAALGAAETWAEANRTAAAWLAHRLSELRALLGTSKHGVMR